MTRGLKLRHLAALLAFCIGGSASALDAKLSGDLNNRFGLYTDQAPMYSGSETIGTISAPRAIVQRFPVGETWGELKYRLAGNVATDDQKVRGVVGFEWGAIRYGSNPSLGCTVTGAAASGTAPVACTTGGSVAKNSGGSFSGDGVNTELRLAFTEFQLPTDFKSKVTVGLQPFITNHYLWQETATGVQLTGEPGPFGVKVAWMRGIEFFNANRDDAQFADADNLLARIDLGKQIPNLKLGAFYLYQHREPKNATPAPIAHLLKNFGAANYNINNIGIDGGYKAGPFFANFDAIFQTGTITNTTGKSAGTSARTSFDQQGFVAHADLGVTFGPAKVTYTGWYASGDTNQNDQKINNFIATDVDMNDSIIFFEGGLTDDNYFTEAPYFLDKGAIFNKLAVEYKAAPKLTVGLAGMYVLTAEELSLTGGTKSRTLGTEIDAFISYVLYDGLTVAANAGYLFASDGMDFFEVVKNGKKDHDIFRATAGLRYRFGTGPI
jgi:hypothetical protein